MLLQIIHALSSSSSRPLLACFPNLTDNPVAETEDDDSRIITAKTVFDHIREKAKSLPVLPMSNDTTSSPSLEAFTLTKKRTREMHLELDNDLEVLEIQGCYRTPQSRMAFPHPQRTEAEQEIQIIDEDGQILMFDAGEP